MYPVIGKTDENKKKYDNFVLIAPIKIYNTYIFEIFYYKVIETNTFNTNNVYSAFFVLVDVLEYYTTIIDKIT